MLRNDGTKKSGVPEGKTGPTAESGFIFYKKSFCLFLIFLLLFNQTPSVSAAFLEQALSSDQLKAKSLSDSLFHASGIKAKILPTVLAYPVGDTQCHDTPGDHSGHPPETSHQTCARTPQSQQFQDSSPKDSSCDNRCQEKLFRESQTEQRQKAYEKAKEDAENTGQCNKEILSKEDCQNAQESYQRNQKLAKDYQGLSGVGQFGYASSIALGALTAIAGAGGIISYAFFGGPALALALGIPGLVFGIVFTPLSAAVPSSFHEGLGAALLTPLALGWGLLSGPIATLSGGWGKLPGFGTDKNKTVDSYFKHLHTAAQIAGTAATLAAAGTLLAAGAFPLAGSAVTIPAASSIVSAITPAGAIAAGSAALGGGIAWGIKELALHVAENKKIKEKEEKIKLEQAKRKEKEIKIQDILNVADKEWPGNGQNPQEWRKKLEGLSPERLNTLHQHILQDKKTVEKLKYIYKNHGYVVSGANGDVSYTLPEAIVHLERISDPETAGLKHYGTANAPQDNNPLFSLWGPAVSKKDRQGLEVPISDGYGKLRKKYKHRGIDFDAPQGTLVVANRKAHVVYARYSGKENKGNWGNLAILAYEELTLEKGSFGMYGHFGWKELKYDKQGNVLKKDTLILGEDVPLLGLMAHEGDYLGPGDIIGLVGNTGRVKSRNPKSTGVHLHYQHVEFSVERLKQLRARWEKDGNKARSDDADKIIALYQDLLEQQDDESKARATYNFVAHRLVQDCFTIDPATNQYGDCK